MRAPREYINAVAHGNACLARWCARVCARGKCIYAVEIVNITHACFREGTWRVNIEVEGGGRGMYTHTRTHLYFIGSISPLYGRNFVE